MEPPPHAHTHAHHTIHTHTQSEFLDKNNDALHASLEQLISASKDPFINQLFPGATNKGGGNTKKLVLDSVGSKFRVRALCVISVCV